MGAAGQTGRAGDERYLVLGVPVSVTTLEDAKRTICGWAADDRGRYICIRDVHGVVRAYDDPALASVHRAADMVAPDGMPLVWLGRLAGKRVGRTCGPDLFELVIADGRAVGLKHYFYGGAPEVAERLRDRFTSRFPGVSVVGVEQPPFRPLTLDELQAVATRINVSRADVVWVGLSTPRQEFLIAQLAGMTRATVIGVGAAFDFHSGAVKRAPRWTHQLGLESLYRLANEPRRLWRRYLLIAPRFLWLLMTSRETR